MMIPQNMKEGEPFVMTDIMHACYVAGIPINDEGDFVAIPFFSNTNEGSEFLEMMPHGGVLINQKV